MKNFNEALNEEGKKLHSKKSFQGPQVDVLRIIKIFISQTRESKHIDSTLMILMSIMLTRSSQR
jgi:hypothetical protein